MEGQEGVPIPAKEQIIQKSPQELAAQVDAVFGTLVEFTRHPEGEAIDQRYKENRKFVETLLESGVSNEQLGEELGRLYEQGRDLGLYSPLRGERADEFLAYAKEYYRGWGIPEDEAEQRAKEALAKQGFVAEVRKWRHDYEKGINQHFVDAVERHPLSGEEEAEKIRQLRERVVYLSHPDQVRALAAQFPGGNYLYHGTKTEQAIGILESGALVNAKTLHEAEEARLAREGGERRFIKRNSGYEGVSWNYNDIGALPGDRYHLVGFLASPDRILSDDLQLAVPSRPAPHELILLNGNIDSQRFYSLKTQQELLMSFGIGESNAVWSNIAQLSFYRENQAKGESNIFAKECMLQTYVDQGQGDVEMAEALRGLYTVRQNGTIDFSTDLLQQVKDEVPVAAVWFQALIDTGRIKNVRGFEDVTTVRQAVERVDRDNYKEFLVELRKDKIYLEDAVKEEDDKVTSIGVPVSEMYLVVPNTDLDRYLKVLTRCKVQPRGIIVYDHLAVRLENFASKHKGDDKPLADVLRAAIPKSDGYIDYESQILGTPITPDKMAGYRKHVIGEKYLKDRKSIRKDEQGKLAVV